MILILTGVSCAGKSTQALELINKHGFTTSLSYTSRQPRINETNGENYYFISKTNFQKKINDNFFLEHTYKFDNYYGTSFEDIENKKVHSNVVLCLCPLGFLAAKAKWKNQVVGIYLMPPSIDELLNRFNNRQDNEQDIKKRINEIFKTSLKDSTNFKHIIFPDSVENITKQILNILNI